LRSSGRRRDHGAATGATHGEGLGEDGVQTARVWRRLGRHKLARGFAAAAGSLGVSASLVVALKLGVVELVEDGAGLGSVVEGRILLRPF